jgi:hypothetical protein
MAYDEELADRIRTLLGDRAGRTEQKMFGGLAFLVGGSDLDDHGQHHRPAPRPVVDDATEGVVQVLL